jgi:hypothetical protein
MRINVSRAKIIQRSNSYRWSAAQTSFSLPESVLDESTTRFRRLQNSPSAQTVVIADLSLRQTLLAKTPSMAAQMDICWATAFCL